MRKDKKKYTMSLCIPTTMHELFTQVLNKKDLSKAGDLFSVADQLIVNDLTEVVNKIREISSLPDYLNNDNDQSVVEICITRVTSAIRETGSIEQHSQALVALLESCLSHDLKPSNRDEDPPHAKISSDVISCIFLNYGKRQVMKLALPIAVKFLHKGNKELSRNMSSYLSLAAIGNADLLAEHIQPIIDSVISGNYSLSRVLPQIYAVNKEPIHDHVMALVSLLPLCENPEKLALLTLFGLIAKNKPSLLDPSLPQLCECLTVSGTSAATLQIFLDMSSVRPQPLIEHLAKMKQVADRQPNTTCLACQVISAVSKLSKEKSQDALDYILGELCRVDHASQALLLKEVSSLCSSYPVLLTEKVVGEVTKCGDSTSSGARMLVQQLKAEFSSRNSGQVSQTSGRITIVKVGGESSKTDLPSLLPQSGSCSSIQRQEASSKPEVTGSRVLGSRQKLSEAGSGAGRSRLGSSVHVNRSMTRLNSSGGRLLGSSSAGLHKSMTRLNSNQQINLGMVPSALSVNQSVSAIGSSRGNVHHSGGGGRVSSGSVTVTTTLGTINPNKSTSFLTTSSGSMSALREERDVTLVSITTTFPHHPQAIPTAQIARDTVLPGPPGLNLSNLIPLNQSGSRLHYPPPLHHSGAVMAPSLSHSGTTIPLSQSGTTSPLSQSGTAISSSSSPLNHLLLIPPPPPPPPLSTSSSAPPLAAPTTTTSHLPPHIHSHGHPSFPLPPPPAASSPPPLSGSQATTLSGVTYTRRTNTSVTVISNSQGQTSLSGTQRISVFEPYPMRDTVQHFCEKHLDKIKSYMEKVLVKIPLPAKCTIEERKSRKLAKLHFACQGRGEHCLYNKTLFAMKTRNPRIWIHLMFLAQQARSSSALSTREASVSSLKNCWDILKFENKTFLTLVTSAFPSAKDQDMLLHELRNNGFFDVFEYNGPRKQWGCFLCNHPDRALGFLRNTEPVIEGQLKEKKGKWKIFKRWRTRYFTLSGVHLSCRGTDDKEVSPIEVTQIRSVKVTRGGRNIPKAFEIFTNDKSFVLKAKDGKNAEEWVQCLSIVVAHSHAKEIPSKTASLQSHVGSLRSAV